MSDILSIADLVDRKVPLAWYEAVAIVRGVCELLIEESASGRPVRVPEPGEIWIAAGHVKLAPGRSTSVTPVRQLARLLPALLERSSPPAEMALFVAQTTSDTPLYVSIEDFSRGVAYFERPGREELLRSVSERGIKAARTASVPSGTDSHVRDPATTMNVATGDGDLGRLLSVRALFLMSAGGVALALLAWSRTAGGGDMVTAAVAGVGRATSIVSEDVASTISDGREWLVSLGLVDPAAHPQKPAAATTGSPAPVAGVAAASARALRSRSGRQPAGASRTPSTPPSVATGPPSTAGPAGALLPGPSDTRVYSTADEGVEPPVPLHELPRVTPAIGTEAENSQMSVELLIGVTGEVEKALPLPPIRYEHRYLVSVLKAVPFRPATKDGHPVRYRLQVKLAQ